MLFNPLVVCAFIPLEQFVILWELWFFDMMLIAQLRKRISLPFADERLDCYVGFVHGARDDQINNHVF